MQWSTTLLALRLADEVEEQNKKTLVCCFAKLRGHKLPWIKVSVLVMKPDCDAKKWKPCRSEQKWAAKRGGCCSDWQWKGQNIPCCLLPTTKESKSTMTIQPLGSPQFRKYSWWENNYTPRSLFFNKFYWNVVNLQCCVSFRYRAKWLIVHIHISILLKILFPYWLLQNPE